MYQNGKQINHYANKKYHRNLMKDKHTPLRFNSYYDYCLYEKQRDEEIIRSFGAIPWAKNGWKPWYETWWKHDGQKYYSNGGSWKGRLKESTNSKRRAYYRDKLSHVDFVYDEDGEIEIINDFAVHDRFDDPWNWD